MPAGLQWFAEADPFTVAVVAPLAVARYRRTVTSEHELKPTFFAPAEFRAWLEKHHATASRSCWSASTRRAPASRASPGRSRWTRRSASAGSTACARASTKSSYTIRFTPRKPGSIWSAVNVAPGGGADAGSAGCGRPGLRGVRERRGERRGIYALRAEGRRRARADAEKRFRANEAAWEFFQAQPPWYRRTATWWVVSAKKEETRERRLEKLIADSAQGEVVQPLRRRA